MRFHSIVSFLLIPSLVFISCKRNFVKLDYTNAKDEVAPLTNLVFRFDKSLIADSLLNHWDSTKYISFEPSINGKFRWEHGDELVFSPSSPLLPATNYRATLNSDILQYSKYDHFSNAGDIRFHTPELKLENTNCSWLPEDENSKTYAPQIDLFFNYAVDPNVLKQKLSLKLNDKTLNYVFLTLSPSQKISVRLSGIPTEDKDLEIKLQLDKGLLPTGGSNGTADNTSLTAMIPSPFVLRVNEVEANPEGAGGVIQVTTSQRVSSAELSSFIRIEPSVKFTTEITDNGFLIRSDAFNVEKTYMLTLKKGLRGEIGGSLVEDYFNNLAFGALEPAISFQNSKGIYLSGKGEKNIEVRITNVAKVKLVISKIYENNLLAAQKYGYYPKEKDYDAEYEESAGTSAGDIIYEQEIDTRLLPKYGSSRLLHMDMEDKLPEFKGIYHILIRSTKDYWVRESRMLSLSDIGLIAKEGSEHLLVFANSLQSAQPIQGVNMIAYGANNQILGTATTNEQGVADISFKRREFAGFKPAMIIAKTAEDFNFLPFNSTRVNTTRFDVGGKNLNVTGLDAYIYPERDIYRPGEQINYSVILRDYKWKSPGDIPIKLKFLFPNGKEFKSFRKSLNEQGSMESNIDLPVSAITGTYSLEVYTSNDILLASQPFHVEEFVPDRIKLTARLNKDYYEPGNTAELKIQAVNFLDRRLQEETMNVRSRLNKKPSLQKSSATIISAWLIRKLLPIS